MVYQQTTLKNGVRIASCEMPEMKSVSVGLWVSVGGRHEPAPVCGISHFLEHLLFKGTEKRTAKRITEEVESLGGFINAFTTEDHTCFYAKVSARHLEKVSEVLCDMYLNSLISPDEVERERDVIREEILMYRDQPAQYSQELLSEAMWPAHALGRPLTGSIETLAAISRQELLGFINRNYNGQSTIVTVAGRCRQQEVVAAFGAALGQMPRGQLPTFDPWNGNHRDRQLVISEQETEQTHLALGYHAISRTDERRYALKLLSVILGENMSSRLFQQLRERYAYCYSVHSGTLVLQDSGLVSIGMGLELDKLRKALQAISRELAKLRQRPPSKKETYQAQEYTIGQNELSLESTTNQIMWMGESILAYDKIVDPKEVQEKLKAVTPEDIQQVANFCFSRAKMGLALVGPVKEATVQPWVAGL
jgi:predicted Zn-dependent peptidase